MVNFYPAFVVPTAAARSMKRWNLRKELQANGHSEGKIKKVLNAWSAKNPMVFGTIHDVVDHIVHIIQVAGIDHVGLGADFDGVDALPAQLEDVSTYPRITQALLDRGYTAEQIRKIYGGNILRVMRAAEAVADQR